MKISKISTKNWGVFIYACGNNDLEPEITRSVIDLEGAIHDEHIAVAVQLARAPRKIVTLLRPDNMYSFRNESWNGVRRFILDGKNAGNHLSAQNSGIEGLGNINMSAPSSLVDFLDWAFSKINARNYILILSGHGASFIGAMADLTHGRPQIMGIPQMAKALKMSTDRAHKKFKLLIMDACYMNLIETNYEFAISEAAEVFIGSGGLIPLEGYNYKKLIRMLYCLSPLKGTNDFKKKLNISEDLGAAEVSLDKRPFKAIKQMLSKMAKRLIFLEIKPSELNDSDELLMDLKKFLSKIKTMCTDNILEHYVSDILFLLNKLYLQNRGAGQNLFNIFCPAHKEDFIFFVKYYLSLEFTKNNFWPQWLAGAQIDMSNDSNGLALDSFNSIPLPLELLTQHLLSLNPQLNMADIHRIYLQLS